MDLFAYGSNMCTARLRARVPSARPIEIARLADHELRFHKRGWRDGSGKANVFQRADPEAHVWGVLFEIDEREKPDLDRIEGLGRGYDETRLPVTTASGATRHAWLYRAHPSAIAPDLLPFRWYRDLVLTGAREHGLPDGYIRRHIECCSMRTDPDRDRALRHHALIPATVTPAVPR